MKAGIHPDYAPSKITCACGRVTETNTTVGEIHVEICSHCHPFFTGKQKLVDTAGRVERFKAKYGDATPKAKSKKKEEPVAEAEVAEAPAEEAVEEAPAEVSEAEETTAEAEEAPAAEAEEEGGEDEETEADS